MKKVIFAITLIFIGGLPFSSQAVKSVCQEKAVFSVEKLSKKQKRQSFFQRIIQRKLDRKFRKKTKRGNELANKSLGFGLGSILVLGFELLVGTLLPVGLDSGLLFMLLLGFNLTAFLLSLIHI